MAKLVRLQKNEELPEAPWALVEWDKRQNIGTMSQVVHSSGATFYVQEPYGEAEEAAAIGHATGWADRNGISTVYVAARGSEPT